MKIMYRRMKISAKICEIDNFKYLQKLMYTTIMLKISNNIYTARFPISSSTQSSNNKLHQLTFKSKFNYS